jgi:hypothetical protein
MCYEIEIFLVFVLGLIVGSLVMFAFIEFPEMNQ